LFTGLRALFHLLLGSVMRLLGAAFSAAKLPYRALRVN
jgi:hypothetical protein